MISALASPSATPATTSLAAQEQQVRDICARNHQHEPHCAEQHEDRRAHVAHDHIFIRANDRHLTSRRIRRRERLEPRRQRLQLARRLRQRCAGTPPGDQIDITEHAFPERGVRRRRRRGRQRHPGVDAPRVFEIARHDAHDREALPVERQLASGYVVRAAVPALP
jgi:hypothetical protein